MAKIDQRLVDLLKSYGEDNTSVWDCHGTWVAYHSAVERMAAKANIEFFPPEMIVNDHEKKNVVIIVTAKMGDKREWSFGEVSPANNKNAYPYAMAEKRAKDRVALKLLGMSGLVYSEEEADDFKESKPKSSASLKRDDAWSKAISDLEQDFLDVTSEVSLEGLHREYRNRSSKEGWTQAWKDSLEDVFIQQKNSLHEQSLWNELTSITTLRGLKTFWEDSFGDIKAIGAVPKFTAKKDEMKLIFEANEHPINAG